jgi:hypothetical protein
MEPVDVDRRSLRHAQDSTSCSDHRNPLRCESDVGHTVALLVVCRSAHGTEWMSNDGKTE